MIRDKRALASLIDHSLLKAAVTIPSIEELCREALNYGFASVAVNGSHVERCFRLLAGSQVKVTGVIAFPLGQGTLESKLFEAKDVIERGALELDYVINISELKAGNSGYIEEEMASIVELCRANGVASKVIFENCYLTEAEKRELCRIALKAKPDFIKSSTGFGTGGATIEDIRLMRSIVKTEIKIKASGGIRTLEQLEAMVEAGADRIGVSCSVYIMEEFLSRGE